MAEKKMTEKIREQKWVIATLVFMIITAGVIIWLFCIYSSLKGQVAELNNIVKASGKTPSEYEKILEFFKNEAEQYRDFIQKQQAFLLWLVALIGTLATSVLGFLGFKKKQDVEEIFDKEYSKEFKAQLTHALGGDKKRLEYLPDAIIREETAKEKKVLFAKMEDDDANGLDSVRAFFEQSGYAGVSEEVELLTRKNINQKIKKYSIVVFQVPQSELLDASPRGQTYPQGKEKPSYALLSDACVEAEKNCVLFTAKKYIYTDVIDEGFAATTQFHAKLRETLYMLLHFSPSGS